MDSRGAPLVCLTARVGGNCELAWPIPLPDDLRARAARDTASATVEKTGGSCHECKENSNEADLDPGALLGSVNDADQQDGDAEHAQCEMEPGSDAQGAVKQTWHEDPS